MMLYSIGVAISIRGGSSICSIRGVSSAVSSAVGDPESAHPTKMNTENKIKPQYIKNFIIDPYKLGSSTIHK